MKLKLIVGSAAMVLSSAALAQALVDPSLSRAYAESGAIPAISLATPADRQPANENVHPPRGPTVNYALRSESSLSHTGTLGKATKHQKKTKGKKALKRQKSKKSKPLK